MGKLEEFKEERAALNKKVAELDKTIESLSNAQWFLEEGEDVWFVDQFGNIQWARWENQAWSDIAFTQGHIFETEKRARLEAQRRNLLQRFKMFRDKSNGDWEVDWSKQDIKYFLSYSQKFDVIHTESICIRERFNLFGYFKNLKDAEKSIELYGDEIKTLFVDCEG